MKNVVLDLFLVVGTYASIKYLNICVGCYGRFLRNLYIFI